MANTKILVCDDESAVVDVIVTRLKALGYEACTASDGEEAFLKIKAEKPSIIITDVLMPKQTGYELLKKIRSDNETKNIPAIVMSAKGSMRDFFAGISNVNFIPKPYDANVLIETIEKLLSGGIGAQNVSKNVVLVGVEEQVLAKVQECLLTFGLHIFRALHEEDALSMVRSLRPKFILCQFWEDVNILDPVKLVGMLSKDAKLSAIPFYVFCKQGSLALDAMKNFKGDRLIAFSQNSDLLKKLEELFKEKAPA